MRKSQRQGQPWTQSVGIKVTVHPRRVGIKEKLEAMTSVMREQKGPEGRAAWEEMQTKPQVCGQNRGLTQRHPNIRGAWDVCGHCRP